MNEAKNSCDLLSLYVLSVTIVSLNGILSTIYISTVTIEICPKQNTETKSNVITKEKHNEKNGLMGETQENSKTDSQKNSIVNSNDKKYCNIDNKNISKVTYNVKICHECLEIVKVKV